MITALNFRTILNALLLFLVWLALASELQAGKPPSGLSTLAAPSQLTASLVAPDQALLSWQDNSSSELQFNIERSTDSFKTITTFPVAANVTQFTDSGLLPSTTYAYRVRAANKKTVSSPSNVASVTTPAPTPAPAAPSGLTAATLDPSEIALSWQDNSTDEQQFSIERAAAGLPTVQILTGPNVTTYTDSGLQSGTLYTYRVRACANGSCSDYSNSASANTGIVIGQWAPLFQGVVHATGLTAVANSPQQVVNALRVDLTASGIAFYSTSRSPNYQPEVEETQGMTTSHWLLGSGLQAAINGNWFSPCCTTVDGSPEEVMGLALSNYEFVSVQESADYSTTLLVTAANQPRIIPQNWPSSVPADIQTAVAGKNPVLVGGTYVGTNTTIAPRTAVGISADSRYLFLMTIDGRQPGYSDGAADADTAAWMTRFGASDAFNLDGGGSTTMAVADGQGGAVLLNQPINGSPGVERAVANHLGLRAQPLSAPSAVVLARSSVPALGPATEHVRQVLADALVDPSATLTVTTDPNGQRHLTIHGAPDYTYQVQFSDPPEDGHWQILATGAANESGELELIDQTPNGSRSYRLVRP